MTVSDDIVGQLINGIRLHNKQKGMGGEAEDMCPVACIFDGHWMRWGWSDGFDCDKAPRFSFTAPPSMLLLLLETPDKYNRI